MKILSIIVFSMLFLTNSFSAKVQYDKDTGLIVAPGMDIVKANCVVCHSAKFITFQRGDRDDWLSMIRWMQKTQGLWEFDKKTEDTILTYLEVNYPPGATSRRPNLSLNMLPKNPLSK